MKDEGKSGVAPEALRSRTLKYALLLFDLSDTIPNNPKGWVISKQILKSATSVGAQYREACRAKSNADFVSKMEGSLQELEESEYWLELLAESGFVPEERFRRS